MRVLYHHWLSAPARKLRLVLAEKGFPFRLQLEEPWQRRRAFLEMDPAGEVPVLVEPDGHIIADHSAACEYLDETYTEPPLLGANPRARHEVRRLVGWFDRKFAAEVTDALVGEKAIRRLSGTGEPDSRIIRAGRTNIHTHLNYITWLVDRRAWLAGDDLSLADLAAAAHLSVVDYIGDVPWGDHPLAKDWYARLKSRPGFRPLLADKVPGIPPPRHYPDLDF